MEYDHGHTPFAQVAVRVRDSTRIGIVQAVLCDLVIVRFDDGTEETFSASDVDLVGH